MCQTQCPPRDNYVNCDGPSTSLPFSLVLFVFPVFCPCFGISLTIKAFHILTSLFLLPLHSSLLFPANSFPDRLVMFVVQKMENSNERSRMGSLAVLRHLINSTSEELQSDTSITYTVPNSYTLSC